MNPTTPRPFKIWSSDRQTKKSLVARSLAELQTKGKFVYVQRVVVMIGVDAKQEITRD